MHVIDNRHDMTQPIALLDSHDGLPFGVHTASSAYNRFMLNERESHGKRPQVRVTFEVMCRSRKGRVGYSRLRKAHMTLSLPSAEQAELVIETIRAVCKSLEGKVLCKRNG